MASAPWWRLQSTVVRLRLRFESKAAPFLQVTGEPTESTLTTKGHGEVRIAARCAAGLQRLSGCGKVGIVAPRRSACKILRCHDNNT